MKIAIVDIGTNTSRLFIAEVGDHRILRSLARVSCVTRLGARVDLTGALNDDALGREHRVLTDYARQIRETAVDRTVAVMTSAVRDATNGAEFAADVAARYRWETEILTGEVEAGLTYRGATDEVDPRSQERILVIDIGGGSTELVLGHGITPDFHVSTQAGVVRQADRHIHGEHPTDAELADLAEDVAATLASAIPPSQRTGVDRTLAVAGTPTSLAAIDQGLDPYDPTRVHGYRLRSDEIRGLYDRLKNMSLAELRELKGLHPDRASVIVPGVVILCEVIKLFGLEQIEVSEHDILRGAALHYSDLGPQPPER